MTCTVQDRSFFFGPMDQTCTYKFFGSLFELISPRYQKVLAFEILRIFFSPGEMNYPKFWTRRCFIEEELNGFRTASSNLFRITRDIRGFIPRNLTTTRHVLSSFFILSRSSQVCVGICILEDRKWSQLAQGKCVHIVFKCQNLRD